MEKKTCTPHALVRQSVTLNTPSDVDQRIYFTPWRDTGLRRVMGWRHIGVIVFLVMSFPQLLDEESYNILFSLQSNLILLKFILLLLLFYHSAAPLSMRHGTHFEKPWCRPKSLLIRMSGIIVLKAEVKSTKSSLTYLSFLSLLCLFTCMYWQ